MTTKNHTTTIRSVSNNEMKIINAKWNREHTLKYDLIEEHTDVVKDTYHKQSFSTLDNICCYLKFEIPFLNYDNCKVIALSEYQIKQKLE